MQSNSTQLVTTKEWADSERRLAEQFGVQIVPLDGRRIELLNAEVATSEFSLSDVASLFASQRDLLMRFATAWYFDCNSHDYGEEWDPAEGDQQRGADKTRQIDGITQGYLLGYTMLLLYAMQRPSDLVAYIKRRRIPHAAKVAQDVRRLYRLVSVDAT